MPGHQRCSSTSLFRRYFTAMHRVPESILRRQVQATAEPTAFGLVAATGSEIVGFACAHPTGPLSVEMAVLVEDGHQRRGIGTVLVNQLITDCQAGGVRDMVAVTLSDNHALVALLRRAGLQPRTGFDDGLRQLPFSTTPATTSTGSGPR